MTGQTLDLREVPPSERHPKVFDAFAEIDSGEALTLVNDHDPKPLYYQMQAEIEDFDADGYVVDRIGSDEFIATLRKK